MCTFLIPVVQLLSNSLHCNRQVQGSWHVGRFSAQKRGTAIDVNENVQNT